MTCIGENMVISVVVGVALQPRLTFHDNVTDV